MKTIINLVFALFLFNNSIYSQIKYIEIISTQSFQIEDKNSFKELRTLLIGEKENKKQNFQFKIKSFINNRSIEIREERNLDIISSNSINNFEEFKTAELFSNYVNQFSNKENYVEYEKSSDLDLSYINQFYNLKDLVKFIKKTKNNKIIIIWNNGYKPYLFSTENISNTIKNTLDKQLLTPQITKPFYNEVLRPDESHYKIEFDSVGIFPSYEISIYWKICVGKDVNDNKIFDSILFIKECIDFSTYDDFLEKKSNTNFGMYSITDSRKCIIEMKENYLSNLCFQKFSKVMSTSDVIDDNCEPCKSYCLYQKLFSIEIKGCANNLKTEQLPKNNVQLFQFQCNKSLN
jgi:hypothetical protein